jgi:hypothetical protein
VGNARVGVLAGAVRLSEDKPYGHDVAVQTFVLFVNHDVPVERSAKRPQVQVWRFTEDQLVDLVSATITRQGADISEMLSEN